MTIRKQINLLLSAIVVVSVLLTACEKPAKELSFNPDEINEIFKTSPNRLQTADSLLALGVINQTAADAYKIEYYGKVGDMKRAEALADSALSRKPQTEMDRFYRLIIVSNSVDHDVTARRYAAGLQKAQQVLDKFDGTDDAAFINQHHYMQSVYLFILTNVARCNINLERNEQADANIHQFLHLIDKFANQAQGDSATMQQWANKRVMYLTNICLAYCNMRQWDRAQSLLTMIEKSMQEYARYPQADQQFLQTYSFQISCVKATILEMNGHHQEAAQAYEEFMKNPFANSEVGRVNSVNYLIFAQRYDEAESKINDIEEVVRKFGMKMDLQTLNGVIKNKFRAHLGAGHRDSALAVATRILNQLDSAEVWEKRDKAAEMAVVHETHQKDAEIAEKEASLLHTRVIALAILLSLLLVFFVIHALVRRHARSRLQALNEQLETANSQLAQNNQLLTVANERAEESSRMKTNFIQQISHEIRTPLNILSGFSQILTDDGVELDATARKDINRQIIENTDRITGLVNKMLELSEANCRTFIELNDHVPVTQIANEAVAVSGIDHTGHLDFELKAPAEAETTILNTSLNAAARALTLLLDNARKFTAPAEAYGHQASAATKQHATLTIRISKDSVQFVVEDSGIGIPADEAEHIFEEFVQLNEYYDGTGIGLTVARSLARRLGGDIQLDTTYTHGARFILTLPR